MIRALPALLAAALAVAPAPAGAQSAMQLQPLAPDQAPALHPTDWLPAEDTAMWVLLSKTQERELEKDDGIWLVPEFAPEVLALKDQTVQITGFMIPLDVSLKRGPTHFLLGPRLPHCPFCLSVGPTQIVEVLGTEPIPYTYDAVRIEGRLELVDDHENGIFYRLTAPRLVPRAG